jgi:hypothetical protein
VVLRVLLAEADDRHSRFQQNESAGEAFRQA